MQEKKQTNGLTFMHEALWVFKAFLFTSICQKQTRNFNLFQILAKLISLWLLCLQETGTSDASPTAQAKWREANSCWNWHPQAVKKKFKVGILDWYKVISFNDNCHLTRIIMQWYVAKVSFPYDRTPQLEGYYCW